MIHSILQKNTEKCIIRRPIKANPLFNNVVIYFITAIQRSEALKLVKEYGIEGFIKKPFDLDEFNILFKKLKVK